VSLVCKKNYPNERKEEKVRLSLTMAGHFLLFSLKKKTSGFVQLEPYYSWTNIFCNPPGKYCGVSNNM
jgi:hypothetical protein